jgi:hypothetical protein
MTKIMCDLCGRDVQTDKLEAKNHVYDITNHGTQIDMCIECRKALYEWISKRKEENGMLRKKY